MAFLTLRFPFTYNLQGLIMVNGHAALQQKRHCHFGGDTNIERYTHYTHCIVVRCVPVNNTLVPVRTFYKKSQGGFP